MLSDKERQVVECFAAERAALAEAAQVPKQDLSVCQYTAPKRIHLCVSDDEADHNRAFCDGFEPHDVTWAEDAPIAVCVEYVRADLAAAKLSDIPCEFSISLDEVISCLENGFVRCETCGDQEDTKDLDVMSDLRKMRAMLAARQEVKL